MSNIASFSGGGPPDPGKGGGKKPDKPDKIPRKPVPGQKIRTDSQRSNEEVKKEPSPISPISSTAPDVGQGPRSRSVSPISALTPSEGEESGGTVRSRRGVASDPSILRPLTTDAVGQQAYERTGQTTHSENAAAARSGHFPSRAMSGRRTPPEYVGDHEQPKGRDPRIGLSKDSMKARKQNFRSVEHEERRAGAFNQSYLASHRPAAKPILEETQYEMTTCPSSSRNRRTTDDSVQMPSSGSPVYIASDNEERIDQFPPMRPATSYSRSQAGSEQRSSDTGYPTQTGTSGDGSLSAFAPRPPGYESSRRSHHQLPDTGNRPGGQHGGRSRTRDDIPATYANRTYDEPQSVFAPGPPRRQNTPHPLRQHPQVHEDLRSSNPRNLPRGQSVSRAEAGEDRSAAHGSSRYDPDVIEQAPRPASSGRQNPAARPATSGNSSQREGEGRPRRSSNTIEIDANSQPQRGCKCCC